MREEEESRNLGLSKVGNTIGPWISAEKYPKKFFKIALYPKSELCKSKIKKKLHSALRKTALLKAALNKDLLYACKPYTTTSVYFFTVKLFCTSLSQLSTYTIKCLHLFTDFCKNATDPTSCFHSFVTHETQPCYSFIHICISALLL